MDKALQPSSSSNGGQSPSKKVATPAKLRQASSSGSIPWSSSPPDLRIRPPRKQPLFLPSSPLVERPPSPPPPPKVTTSSINPSSRRPQTKSAPSPAPAPAPPPVLSLSDLTPAQRRRLAITGRIDPLPPRTEPAVADLPSVKTDLDPESSKAALVRAAFVEVVQGATSRPGSIGLNDVLPKAGQPSLPSGDKRTTARRSTSGSKRPWEVDAVETQKNRRLQHEQTASTLAQPSVQHESSSVLSIKARVVLSLEQQKILSLVVQEGKSLFFTGSAGTGKSVLLREIIASLRRKYTGQPDAVAVTASTGIAACNIGGVTIHSCAGVGLGLESPEQLATKIRRNKKSAQRWIRTKVWIIDEVSMLDGDLFDKLSIVGKLLRKKPEPFGGIQVVLTGDFFQLPPVSKGEPKFAFEAKAWTESVQYTVNLTQVFRQKDQVFVDMLNEMRFGKLTPKSITRFKALEREVLYEDGLEPTELFPRRDDVDRANNSRLKSLHAEERIFVAHDGGTIKDIEQRNKVLSHMVVPERLHLKVGAQVMLIKNMDETLVNGSIGRVVAFTDSATFLASLKATVKATEEPTVEKAKAGRSLIELPVVRFAVPGGQTREILVQQEDFKVELPNGEVQASRKQLPLVLSWAMSIHKSQGQTLERVRIDLRRIFEKGQAYVALSRATSMKSLQVIGFDAAKVQAHPKVGKWSNTLESLK